MNNHDLLKIVGKYDTVVIFGAGFTGLYLYNLLIQIPNKKVIIFDNASKRRGCVQGVQVVSVNEIKVDDGETLYCISSRIHENIMRQDLYQLGIKDANIIVAVTDEADLAWQREKEKQKMAPLKKIQFEIDLVSHCNLNCRCCSQFSGIADKEFISVYEMEKDLRRMSEIFQGKAERIYLIGGEPLLHPQIGECMEIARRYFQDCKIAIFTNGILLEKCEYAFWDICRMNNISITITKYPINLNYKRIEEILQNEKVKYEFFGASEDYKYMNNLGLVQEGNMDKYMNFINCSEANNCIKLKNGKLYTCTRPAAIYRFNKYFGLSFKVSKADYVDIYENITSQEILERLSRPIPFCRYCDMCGKRKSIEWGITEKKIEEWL